ncbi:unnamed protein product [marine sediment metagenome]|uniref:Uncharacterized protein n=1 Tax=marine sediment metagenome TaxID=412755 RepID=X1DU83_9ZZZZ
MDKLSRHNLPQYLRSIQKASGIQNSKVEPEKMTEQEWAEFCMRDGAARLAEEVIRRYGLDVSEN